MKNIFTMGVILSSFILAGCVQGEMGHNLGPHQYEKKELVITNANAAMVASVIFDLEDFARAPLDMLNDPYSTPKIKIPNLARTAELNVSDQFKSDFLFDAGNTAVCTNGNKHGNQDTFSVSPESHSLIDGVNDSSQQAILSYWFAANHCVRDTGDEENPGTAEITGGIWFTSQWVKGLDGQLANFNGVIKTVNAAQTPQQLSVPTEYPTLYINYGSRNEVRFEDINTNINLSGDIFSITYENVDIYSEFEGIGGSLHIESLSDVILTNKNDPYFYSAGSFLILADQNTHIQLTLFPGQIEATIKTSNGDFHNQTFTYPELLALREG